MAKVTSPTKEVLNRLAEYLKTQMALAQVHLEWPTGNVELKYPALSIFPGKVDFTPQPASEHTVTPGSGVRGEVLWYVGDFDFRLQLDLWCGSKEARAQLYESLFQAFHSMLPISGLSLSLTEYHDIFCRYTLTGHEMMDGEEQAQRKEWRLKADVLAHCEAVVRRTENLIKSGEVTFDSYNEDEETTPINLEE